MKRNRNRKKNKNRLIAFGAASAAALLAVMFTSDLLVPRNPRTVVEKKEPKVQVLVVTTDLQMGARLRPDSLKWQDWPKSNVLAGMIRRDQNENAIEELSEARVKVPMVANEPLLESKILRKGEGGLLSVILPRSMRAVAVKVSTASGAGGFIMPNDRVDVLVTRNINGRITSDLVLENVRVLAVNQIAAMDTEKEDQAAESNLRTVTLEVTPQQAKVLARVQNEGTLTLALRSLAERGDGSLEEDRPRLAPLFARTGGGEIRFYRYGLMRVQPGN